MQLAGRLFRLLFRHNPRNMKRILFLSIVFLSLSFEALASSPEYIALADSADNYIKKERWREAEQTILSALKMEPGNFSNSLLLSNLGVVRTNMGKYQQAVEDFTLGLSIAPRSSVLRTNRARTRLFMGDYDGALADLNGTIEIDSLQQWPLQMRGLLYLGRNKTDSAKNDFSRLAMLNPKSPNAYSGLARVAEIEGNSEEALKLYNKSIEIEDDPETRFSRILLKINMGKYSEANEEINESVKLYPQIPDFYIARGYLHRLNFRNDEALIDKKIALDKGADPQLVEQFIPKIRK